MTTVGPNNAGTGATSGADTAWTNPGNITADDSSYATCAVPASTGKSQYLQATNFGFSIPAGATINGITAKIKRKSGSSLGDPFNLDDTSVLLLKAGTATGNDKSTGAVWNYTSDTVVTFGGSADLWGASWSDTDINDTNFGVEFKCKNQAATPTTASVNVVTMTIDYTAAGGGGTAVANALMMMGCGT